jgi:hypothetical protein
MCDCQKSELQQCVPIGSTHEETYDDAIIHYGDKPLSSGVSQQMRCTVEEQGSQERYGSSTNRCNLLEKKPNLAEELGKSSPESAHYDKNRSSLTHGTSIIGQKAHIGRVSTQLLLPSLRHKGVVDGWTSTSESIRKHYAGEHRKDSPTM